jgi:hypothetical protein
MPQDRGNIFALERVVARDIDDLASDAQYQWNWGDREGLGENLAEQVEQAPLPLVPTGITGAR